VFKFIVQRCSFTKIRNSWGFTEVQMLSDTLHQYFSDGSYCCSMLSVILATHK